MNILIRTCFRFSKISFIGLGNMGMNMASNLIKNGNHQVYGYDIDFKKQQQAKKHNIIFRKDLKTIIKDSNIFILMTPSSKQSKQLCQSQQYGIFNYSEKGSLIMDCSTIAPNVAKQLNEKGKKNNMTYVDVPCSGGMVGAHAGTLSFMIGAENQQVFQKVKNICSSMGKRFFNCGSPGGALSAKICNNLALGIQMIAISQALSLGVKLGVDPKILSDIMSVSTAQCWSVDKSNPVPGVHPNSPASKDYSCGYYSQWMLKDFNLAIEASKTVGAKVEIAQHSKEMYTKIINNGAKGKDFGIIFKYLLENKL